jgi:hypothetical protein
MRALTVVVSAALLSSSIPALAAFDKREVKCRSAIADNVRKVALAATKVIDSCHMRRNRGASDAPADCNKLGDQATDPKGKVAAAEAKMKAAINKACGGLDGDVLAGFVSCPMPCRRLAGVGNPIATFSELSDCLACGARAFAGSDAAAKLGAPPVGSLGKADSACHKEIAKQARLVDDAILKTQIDCQKKADAAGQNDPAACMTADPKGVVAKKLTKADAGIEKACATATLAHLDSCSSTSTALLRSCVAMPRGGFGAGFTLFNAAYGLAPSRGEVHGVAVLDLATQEGVPIALAGVEIGLRQGGQVVATTVTNLKGEFAFASQRVGTYQLFWDTPGYLPGQRTTDVTVVDDVVTIPESIALTPDLSTPGVGVLRGKALLADGTPCPVADPFLGLSESAVVSVVDGGNVPLAPPVPTNTSGDFVLAGVPFADLTVRAVCAGSTVEQHIQPAALDLSGFSPTDLAWTNHSPQAISITAQSGGMIVDTFQPGATLQLSAQVDDADNDPLSYQWRVDDPSDVLVANGPNATLHLSDRPGQHGVALSAHDALGGWDAIKLINPCLTVSPVPNPNIFPERAKNPMFQSLIPPWDGYPSSIFLTRKGTGTAQDACTYYNLIDPACDDLNCDGVPDGNAFGQPCKRITLGGWWEVNGFNPLDGSGADVTRAFYENHNDLGFGREMNCRKATNGNVACFVSNYGEGDQNPNNVKLAVAANPICAKATVAMEYSPVDF